MLCRETTFWRRQPAQLAGTLAFMLSGDAAAFGRIRGSGRVRAAEVEPFRECLLWLRHNNPHMQIFLSNAEQFVSLYQTLQSLLPQGQTAAPVRLRRTSRAMAAVESTLGETLGAETDVLVVVDPVDLPRGFYSVDVLAEQIGDAAYRAESSAPGTALPPPSFRNEAPAATSAVPAFQLPAAEESQAQQASSSPAGSAPVRNQRSEVPHAHGPAASPPRDSVLPPAWGRDMQSAAERLRARVTLGDPHLWMPNCFPDSYLMARVPAGPRLAAVLCNDTAVL